MAPTENFYLKTPQASILLPFATKTYPHLPNIITLDKSYLILCEMHSKRKKERSEVPKIEYVHEIVSTTTCKLLCVSTDAVLKFDCL